MRLFIVGATGHTGIQITDLALAQSHAVTAFVRPPEKLFARRLREGQNNILESIASKPKLLP
jgi:putative NADH-flavin reductase